MSTATDLYRALKAVIDQRNSLILDDDQTQQIQALANIARGLGMVAIVAQIENVLALDHNNRIRQTRAIVIGRDQTLVHDPATLAYDRTEIDRTEIDGNETTIGR